jgi:hypothetical protein
MALSHPYMNRTAAPIVESLLDSALASGCTVSVFDGEAWAIKISTDKGEIFENLAQTESGDTLRLRDKATRAVLGSIWLIYENGVDVISDHTDSPEIRDIVRHALASAGVE